MIKEENYISEIDILDEAKDSFLTYSAEVLTDRAIPAAEDGLLSAQRKILWTMEDYLKMNSKSKTKKCNAIVGSTLATSYFHGDISCYGVLCKMSQDYLMRYPLIIGQGSLGTQEANDMVASSRYTEAKPSIYADLMMENFKKDVVPLKETYNGEFMEPVILPALFPNAICNGRQAIGISMAHNSLPHNLGEVCNAIIAYIQNNNLTIDELMVYLPGPDFPLPNTIINKDDIKTAFKTGHSSVSLKVRGEYEIKNNIIIFTSIPYRTYRNKIKEQIEKNIDIFNEILEDFDDESSLGQNKLIFKVKKSIDVNEALDKIFALTDLQTTLSYNMNYIVNGTPKLCSMLDLIKAYVNHQTNIIIKIAEYDKNKAEARKHILEGLILIINSIDKAIELIKSSNDKNEAITKLVNYFPIDIEQAIAILEMKLVRLTKLDKDDLLDELNEKIKIIKECNEILTNESYRNQTLINKIIKMKKDYADPRRTKLFQLNIETKKKDKEIIPSEDVVVILTKSGYIKRVPKTSFKIQKRNGKGIKNYDNVIINTISTNTKDNLMLFTKQGKMYTLLVNNIPEGNNTNKGTFINNLIPIDYNDIISISALYNKTSAKYVVFITKEGYIKKTNLEEYTSIKRGKNGVAAIKLEENDSLANVTYLLDEELILITKHGMAIRFDTSTINSIGKLTRGVKGISLKEDDSVIIGLPIHKYTDSLAIITEEGYGKKIKLSEFNKQNRGGIGIFVSKHSNIAGAAFIEDTDDILLTGLPNSICINATEIPLASRIALGNQLIKQSKIIGVTKL